MYLKHIVAGILFGIIGFQLLPSTSENVVTLSVYNIPDVGFKTYTVDISHAETVPMMSFEFPGVMDPSTLFAIPVASVGEGGILQISVTVGYEAAQGPLQGKNEENTYI